MKTNRPIFRGRAFISVLVSACFILLVFSGAILFLAPPGRIANWTNWQMLQLTKHDWIDVHIWFAIVFLVAGLIHIWFNWKPLVGYFKSRRVHQTGWRWEWGLALILCLGIFAGTRATLPPFSTVLAWNEQLKQHWDTPERRAPIAHAELLTLQELAQQAGVPLETALQRLAMHGFPAVSPKIKVGKLAKLNQLAPAQVYSLLKGQSTVAPAQVSPSNEADDKRADAAGDPTNLSVKASLARLKARGISVEPGTSLSEVVSKYSQPESSR